MILICDVRDPSRYAKAPFNSHKGVRQLGLEDYLRCVRAYEPDIVAVIADSISDLGPSIPSSRTTAPMSTAETEAVVVPGQKRVRKSVDRSLKWLDQVLRDRQGYDTVAEQRALDEERKRERKHSPRKLKEGQQDQTLDDFEQLTETVQDLELKESTPLTSRVQLPSIKTKTPWNDKTGVFAHVVGSHIEQERIRSAIETAKREGVDGFIVDVKDLSSGSGLGAEEVMRLLKVSLDHLPTEKPRLVYGMQTPGG
jgi:queuine tRNA-ribosyltransferase subunit QTRTD1